MGTNDVFSKIKADDKSGEKDLSLGTLAEKVKDNVQNPKNNLNKEESSKEILKKALAEATVDIDKTKQSSNVEKLISELISMVNRLNIRINELHSRIDDIETLIESSLRLTPLEKNLQWLSNILIADIARNLRQGPKGAPASTPSTPGVPTSTVSTTTEEQKPPSKEPISDEGLIRPSQLFKKR